MVVSTNIPLAMSDHPPFLSGGDVAGKDLAFVNGDVWISNQSAQFIDHVSGSVALPAPVPGEPDLMHLFAVDDKRVHGAGHHGPGVDFSAVGPDRDVSGILDALFCRQFGRNFAE